MQEPFPEMPSDVCLERRSLPIQMASRKFEATGPAPDFLLEFAPSKKGC
jgi:hypothetical protein